MEEIPNWIIILSAILSPLLAIVTAVIIVNQYLLSKYRWRLDLFEKRYSIYNNTINFIAQIIADGSVTNEKLFEFLRNTRDRDFLFADDIKSYLNELYESALELYNLNKKLEIEPIGDQRNIYADKESDLLKWFSRQYDIARVNFGKYLSIKKR